MAKLDAYLRSIEKFGAAGAVLTSGQAVTLKFPTGDRNATQVTPHDLLVGMVRELASPTALDAIDANRPARFDIDSEGHRYTVSVAPRPGAWQVTITAAASGPAAAVAMAQTQVVATFRATPPAGVQTVADAGDMAIERGQYAEAPVAEATTSGSTTLDQLTRAARQARATDIYVAAGAQPVHRVGGELVQGGAAAMDAESISRELGIVATAEARAAWSEHGAGMFAYSDGAGRVRVTLARDHRGPCAALRLLPEEPPALERLSLGKVSDWLNGRGLVLVVGGAGAGKTVALASCIRALGDRGKRVVSIENPIEMRYGAATISQRQIGEHVPAARAGVATALSEGVDAIAIGFVGSAESAAAVIEAVAGGVLVLATVNAQAGTAGVEHILGFLDGNQRDHARALLAETYVGAVRVTVGRGGTRSYEAQARPG